MYGTGYVEFNVDSNEDGITDTVAYAQPRDTAATDYVTIVVVTESTDGWAPTRLIASGS